MDLIRRTTGENSAGTAVSALFVATQYLTRRHFIAAAFVVLLGLDLADDAISDSRSKSLQENLHLTIGKRKGLGVSVVDLVSGEPAFSYNESQPLKPASVLKLLTSGAALEHLGPHFHFETEIWTRERNPVAVEELYVRGGGDPSLTIESLWLLVRKLRKLGVRSVGSVVLDDSLFDSTRGRSGQRAFETGSSALSLNHNSILFEVCPTTPGRPAKILHDPWEVAVKLQGGITTVARKGIRFSIDELVRQSQASGHLTYRLGGEVGLRYGCVEVYRSVGDPVNYFLSTIEGLLPAVGIQVEREGRTGAVPKSTHLLYAHPSKELTFILHDLNHFSNNFIGEQIIYALGGSPAGTFSRELGLKRLGDFVRKMGFSDDEFRILDGSGLDHDNRLSARIITAALMRLYKNTEVQPEFENSLSVGMRSGTLEKRSFGTRAVVVRAKTGTLDGVSSLAGFVTALNGKKYGFAILQNEVASKDQAIKLEDKIVEKIAAYNQL